MKTTVRKLGNSHGVIIPKPLLAEIETAPGDPVDIRVRKGRIIIEPIKHDPRAGWAADSRTVHDAGDDRLVWPDLRQDGDKEPGR